MLDIPTARALLLRTRPRRSADGYPAEVRARVKELAVAELAAGHNLDSLSRSLALHRSTLGRWITEAPMAAPSFVPVVVSPPARPAPMPGLVVVSPAGYRIEGLDFVGAIAALRELT